MATGRSRKTASDKPARTKVVRAKPEKTASGKPASKTGHPRRRRKHPPSVEVIVDRRDWPVDFYHRLLTISWSRLFLVLAAVYFAFNLFFAALFFIQDGAIANARPGSFADAFFFSIQTMATIGYGVMAPATLYANILVAIEVLLGMTGFATASGLVFARFSRPTARVMFTNTAVIATHNGIPSLMFRAANRRRNQILEAQATVMMLRDETSEEGVAMRGFHAMEPLRPRTPIFALTWTVIHPIDELSPLYGHTPESLVAKDVLIMISISGIDETASQTVHARHIYRADEIEWDRRFADILGRTEDGRPSVDYRCFHETVAVDSPGATPRVGKA